jgi:hypothetical protein
VSALVIQSSESDQRLQTVALENAVLRKPAATSIGMAELKRQICQSLKHVVRILCHLWREGDHGVVFGAVVRDSMGLGRELREDVQFPLELLSEAPN